MYGYLDIIDIYNYIRSIDFPEHNNLKSPYFAEIKKINIFIKDKINKTKNKTIHKKYFHLKVSRTKKDKPQIVFI